MLYNRCQRGIMNGTILCRMEEYNMTLHEYIEDMRGKRIAIIGIGVSNTPLLELLLAEGIRVRQAQPGADGRAGGASGAVGL